MLHNTPESWGAVTKFLHWSMALLIFTLFALGWTADLLPRSPLKIDVFIWHKSLGILALTLVVIRLLWQLANPTPRPPTDTKPWEHVAAKSAHAFLYILMIAMPISGWVINSAANVPFKVFWLVPLPNLTGPNQELRDVAETAHLAMFFLFATVLVAHIGAAIRHHVVKRNNVLTRMLPGSGDDT
jgi:cytochrome b561